MSFIGQSFRLFMSTVSDHWDVERGNLHPNVTGAVRDRLDRRNTPQKAREYPEDWQHPHKLSNDQKRTHARNGTFVPQNVRRVENGGYENELARDMDFLCAMMRWETEAGWTRGKNAPMATHLEVEMVEDLGVIMPEPGNGQVGLDVFYWDHVHLLQPQDQPRSSRHFDFQWKHDNTRKDEPTPKGDQVSVHDLEARAPSTFRPVEHSVSGLPSTNEASFPFPGPASKALPPSSSDTQDLETLKQMFAQSMAQLEQLSRQVAELQNKDQAQTVGTVKTLATGGSDAEPEPVSFTASAGTPPSAWLPKIAETDEADGKDAPAGALDMTGLHKLLAEVKCVG